MPSHFLNSVVHPRMPAPQNVSARIAQAAPGLDFEDPDSTYIELKGESIGCVGLAAIRQACTVISDAPAPTVRLTFVPLTCPGCTAIVLECPLNSTCTIVFTTSDAHKDTVRCKLWGP